MRTLLLRAVIFHGSIVIAFSRNGSHIFTFSALLITFQYQLLFQVFQDESPIRTMLSRTT